MELNKKELFLILKILKVTLSGDYYSKEEELNLKRSINKLENQLVFKKYK